MSVPARWAARWHLTGAGVENVWLFPREVIDCPSGRSLVTGPNGFTMPVVPGSDRADLSVLSLEAFTQYVTGHGGTVFDRLDEYVTDLAELVFGCPLPSCSRSPAAQAPQPPGPPAVRSAGSSWPRR
ncbi:hypothetical protein ACFY20_44325 [Streptomyces sp. NPDC001312]|uniref:hypothetical protein n=1 Tax=Streptomyces sp. NPDC001312 TaxID=3364561 RepID=UPI0036A17F34